VCGRRELREEGRTSAVDSEVCMDKGMYKCRTARSPRSAIKQAKKRINYCVLNALPVLEDII